MKSQLVKVGAIARRHPAEAAIALCSALAISLSGVAGATTPTLEATFSSGGATLLTEFGWATAAFVVVFMAQLGLRFFVKWIKQAVSKG